MNKEFVTYEQAVALKELGFDEPCFGGYVKLTETQNTFFMNDVISEIDRETPLHKDLITKAPLYQQVFRWFREKHNLVAEIQAPDGKDGVWNPTIHKVYGFGNYYDYNNGFKTYEEAQDACINKIIEICKNKQDETSNR